MFSSFVLTTIFLAENVSAHGRLTQPMTRVGHTGYENNPIGFGGESMTKFACRHEENLATLTTFTAGDTISLEWAITANHVGDAGIYISYDVDVPMSQIHTMEFFKIANIPKTRDYKFEPYQIVLPAWLPAGRAVLRWEWYALHVNPTIELYVQCSDIEIVASSSPRPLSDIPKYTVVSEGGVPKTQFLYNTDGALYRDGFNPGVDFLTGPECAFEFEIDAKNECLTTSVGSLGWVDVLNTGASPVPQPTPQPVTTDPPTDSSGPTPTPQPIDGSDFFLDSSTNLSTRKTLANIGGLLAQCAWESGGDVPFHACDENNWSGSATASCTQRADGSLYHHLTGNGGCAVEPGMQMTAETHAHWTIGPLECTPGTATESCCWWGRGAIQTTGPFNYGRLQTEVVDHLGMDDPLTGQPMNLCTNPEAICQNDELKFVGSFYYWVSVVQQESCFASMLDEYAGTDASPWNNNGGSTSCYKYSTGIGGSINNGAWQSHAHGESGRQNQFAHMMQSLKNGYNAYDGQAPSETCTGDAKIDRILELGNMKLDSAIEDHGVYTWAGFCSTLRHFVDSGSNPSNPTTPSPVTPSPATPSPVDDSTTPSPVTPSPATPSPVDPPVSTTTTPGTAPQPTQQPGGSQDGVLVDESKPDGAKCAGADHHEQPACATGLGCYAQSEWYSGCKPSCPAGWACESEPADLGTAFPERTVGRKCAGNGFANAGYCADGLSCFKRSWDNAPSSWSGCFVTAPTADWILDMDD